MPDIGFYDTNQYINYPFLEESNFSVDEIGSSSSSLCGSSGDKALVKGIVDGGFIMGLDSAFQDGQDNVYLYRVAIAGDVATLDFRSSASGTTNHRWLFSFDKNCGFGTTVQTDATGILSGVPAPDVGTGFIVLGDLEDLFDLVTGEYGLCSPPEIEPALIHNLGKSYVRSVNIANTARTCPELCCPSSSLSLITSSVFVYATDLVGNIRMKEGYNIRLEINPNRNQLEIIAQLNAGEGPNCEDVLIDGDGESGFHRGGSSLCSSCDDYVRSINGLTAPTGNISLNGSSGIRVVSDQNTNTITVDATQIRACQNNG